MWPNATLGVGTPNPQADSPPSQLNSRWILHTAPYSHRTLSNNIYAPASAAAAPLPLARADGRAVSDHAGQDALTLYHPKQLHRLWPLVALLARAD